jgi:2-keto-4-pentenoate hydratase/2-oxohepta-3-ene-1,7-dioic acid hydratase in catechol pathway
MKLVRFGARGREEPGLIDPEGHVRDLARHVPDLRDDVLSPERLKRLAALDWRALPLVEGSPRLGPPVAGVGKILGIGLNYRSHAEETGAKPGTEPLVFSKAVTSLSGPFDPIVIPRHAEKTDWEVELAVIIGSRVQYADAAQALAAVAGYAAVNDVSERAFQKERGGQFVKGKSADSFAPLGPWLVTPDEVADPQDLDLWLDVNGVRKQAGNTRDMIFPVAFLVSHLSQFMTLMPGDVIVTGTPAGVGMGRTPPEFLKPGDVVELGVEGLGQQRHAVVAFAEAEAGAGAA